MFSKMDKWLNTEEAAGFLKCSKTTVYRYCREGLLPYYKEKSVLRFKSEELEKWLERGAKNVLTNLVPIDIEMLKGGYSELAKKKPTCLNYGRVYVRTYRSGHSSETIDYRDENGKRVQLAVEGGREEAIRVLQKKLIEVFKRKQGLERRRKNIGFKTFAQPFREDYMMTARRNFQSDIYRLNILCDYFKETDLRSITPLKVERLRKERLKAGNSKSTCNRYLALMKRLFNVAREEGYAEENPVQKVKLFSEKDTLKERILTEEEEERLYVASANYLKPILVIALNTRMRKGEILNLRPAQIDLKARRIRVEKTKSGKVRHIPINEVLLYELRRLRGCGRGDGLVFFNPSTMKPYVDLKRQFRNACGRAEIKGLRFHDLRHTFATRLAEMGVHIKDIRDLLGHSSITITQRYTHPSDERKKTAVELLSKGKSVTQVVTQGEVC